jgi:transcriptional antiterminator
LNLESENKHQKINQPKYTHEMVEEMRVLYLAEDTQEGRDALIKELSEKYNKPTKSIIAKLSKMLDEEGNRLYKAKQTVSKLTGEKPETKEQLVRRIAKLHNKKEEEMWGLEKAPKGVLLILLGEK